MKLLRRVQALLVFILLCEDSVCMHALVQEKGKWVGYDAPIIRADIDELVSQGRIDKRNTLVNDHGGVLYVSSMYPFSGDGVGRQLCHILKDKGFIDEQGLIDITNAQTGSGKRPNVTSLIGFLRGVSAYLSVFGAPVDFTILVNGWITRLNDHRNLRAVDMEMRMLKGSDQLDLIRDSDAFRNYFHTEYLFMFDRFYQFDDRTNAWNWIHSVNPPFIVPIELSEIPV